MEQSQPVPLPAAITPPSTLAPRQLGEKPLVPPAPALPDATAVVPAVAYDDPGTGSIVQTAGVLDNTTDAVKQGVAKVSEAITPTTPVAPADDPTSLSTKARPTPELHLSMARFYEEQSKPALAEQSYQQALRLAPKHLGSHLAYARFKQRHGQMQAAMQLYQKAAKYHPAEAAIFNDMGLLYAGQGRHAEALAAFGRAIELQPKRDLYRNNIAVLLVDVGQADQAIRHLRVVYPEAEAYYKVGYLLQVKGQTHQAMTSFSRALALNPSMNDARMWLEHLRVQSGGGEPQLARKPADPGIIVERQPPAERPNPGLRNGDPPTAHSPEPDPLMTQRGTVRQLPPVLKPLPAPPAESPSGREVPGGPEIRRLPRTVPERPTSYQEDDTVRSDGARSSGHNAALIPDAPLPPPSTARVPPAPAMP